MMKYKDTPEGARESLKELVDECSQPIPTEGPEIRIKDSTVNFNAALVSNAGGEEAAKELLVTVRALTAEVAALRAALLKKGVTRE